MHYVSEFIDQAPPFTIAWQAIPIKSIVAETETAF
jgi:hypothetical protein